jgi:hypothetical protein
MGLKKLILKFPFLIKTCFYFYGKWSNLYQLFEKKCLKNSYKQKKYCETKDICESWDEYCNNCLQLSHYGRDKWYMRFDVISAPAIFIERQSGDCDDYAMLAYDYFGDNIYYGCKIYNFDGIFTFS